MDANVMFYFTFAILIYKSNNYINVSCLLFIPSHNQQIDDMNFILDTLQKKQNSSYSTLEILENRTRIMEDYDE